MKAFITGSEGFIGTHLKERLIKEGHTYIGLDDLSHPCKYRHGPFIKDDVLNIKKYKNQIKKCDYTVHLAAQINVEKSLKNPRETAMVNFMGTLEILEVARQLDIPFIMASTTEIYGDKQDKRMDEDHKMNPKSPYAGAKMGADGLCKAYYHSYGLPIVLVRNFNSFGKFQSDDKWGAVIAKFADRLINNKPPIIFGDGTQRRDFMSYKDAIDFYMLMLKKGNHWGKEFNVGLGKSISINMLAKKMIKLFNKDLEPIHTVPRPGEVYEFLCDNSRALSIGWKPKLTFDKALKEYIDWKLGKHI